jgi:hypothetical protein
LFFKSLARHQAVLEAEERDQSQINDKTDKGICVWAGINRLFEIDISNKANPI